MNYQIAFWFVVIPFASLWLKVITIGSEFDFVQWFKYGRAYTKWYFNREDWLQYRINHPTPLRRERSKP